MDHGIQQSERLAAGGGAGRRGGREAHHDKEMRLQKTCLPYMVVVAVVMSIYSIFLVHLTQSFRPSFGAEVRRRRTTRQRTCTAKCKIL